jgi:predicted TIM-barrel fold metal-dependent hydrolase
MNYHEDPAKTYMSEPEVSRCAAWRRGFEKLAPRDLSFDLQLYYPQMAEFRELALAFPNVQIILNHAGMQVDGPDHFQGWRDGMRTLSEASNVACKISGLGMGDHNWTVDSIRPYIESTIEALGVERCMFASNFPVDKLFSTYGDIFDAFRTITAGYSAAEKRALFHDNAAHYYRI